MRQQLVSHDNEPLCDEVEYDPEKFFAPMLNTSLYCEEQQSECRCISNSRLALTL